MGSGSHFVTLAMACSSPTSVVSDGGAEPGAFDTTSGSDGGDSAADFHLGDSHTPTDAMDVTDVGTDTPFMAADTATDAGLADGPPDTVPPDVGCAPPSTLCGGACVNTSDDPSNCGACGNVCNGASCSAGHCTCPGGATYCGIGGAGTCVMTSVDPNNGGGFGQACGNGQSCIAGTCMACGALAQLCCAGGACGSGGTCTGGTCACPTAHMNCGGVCVDTATDPSNCGGCGHTCTAGPMAIPTCAAGACGSMCNTGLTMCQSGCTNLQTDPNNCGVCDTVCTAPSGGTTSCLSGTCTPACPASLTDCSGTCTSTATDVNNCGARGTYGVPRRIDYGHAVQVAAAGLSAIADTTCVRADAPATPRRLRAARRARLAPQWPTERRRATRARAHAGSRATRTTTCVRRDVHVGDRPNTLRRKLHDVPHTGARRGYLRRVGHVRLDMRCGFRALGV